VQEFENGQEVDFTHDGEMSGVYIGRYNQYSHAVKYNNTDVLVIHDNNIRPVQLICDKAREKILELVRFKSRIESKDIYDYIEENVCKSGTYLVNNNVLVTPESCVRSNPLNKFNDIQLPELNLKTGEVIPCADDGVSELKKLKLDYNLLHDEKELLQNQLKEKVAEIERLSGSLDFDEAQLQYSKMLVDFQMMSEKTVIGCFQNAKDELRKLQNEFLKSIGM
jgi:hypothetical protein